MLKKPSKKTIRHASILDALKLDPAMRVNELAKSLDVSAETIRRDLSELDAEGRIRRTYGGAVRTSALEPALAEREKLYIAERERIAQCTVDFLSETQSIYIGGGATTLHFARALRHIKRHMTILTASFQIAIELAANPDFDVISLPGTVELQEGLVHGPDTLRFIQDYNVEAAIIGASAIDETGVTEALPAAAEVYGAMIQQAEQTYVVADRSKFGKKSLKRVVNWNPNVTLVADAEPPQAIAQELDALGTRTVVVGQSD